METYKEIRAVLGRPLRISALNSGEAIENLKTLDIPATDKEEEEIPITPLDK
jgi:hypothetical protein